MKLTKENINHINEVLIKDKVHYIDLRIEIIDHLSSELEEIDGDFDAVFPDYYLGKKDFVKQMFLSHLKSDTVKGYKLLLHKIVSWQFLGLFVCIFSIVYLAFTVFGKSWMLENFDIVPILLPVPITAIMLYTFLFSKNKSTDLTSLLGVTNLVIVTYIFGGIYLIRSATEIIWLPLFSFYLAINVAYYFFYFYSKKKHKQKYETLIYTV
jgi:hypothetical protein